MYGDVVTNSMQKAIDETNRRRKIQQKYNEDNNITPNTISKEVRGLISTEVAAESETRYKADGTVDKKSMEKGEKKEFTQDDIKEIILNMEIEMRSAAEELDFERAANIRDKICDMRNLYGIY